MYQRKAKHVKEEIERGKFYTATLTRTKKMNSVPTLISDYAY